MAKPTHPVLVELYSNDLPKMSNESTEVWQVTMQFMLPKGQNVEQIVADISTGKWQNNIPLNLAYTDIVKIK